MKTKSFKEYLERRLDKEKIAELEKRAHLEVQILKSLQTTISAAMDEYMKKNKIGFNELVRHLHSSPTHVAKIQHGKANLTLASLAHLLALIDKEPKDLFKN